ncbi:TolC family protein [Rosistilla oblonga]|uniref:TolC family protein n=1 Tax=Rosistilla oblonga TaxID=2527990 RepID=UPI003A97DF89
MAIVRPTILLIPTATVLVIAGATLAWTQDESAPPRSNPLVVSEPGTGSILVEEVPDRKRPVVPPPVSPPQGSSVPRRLPPVNDLATPHVVVPHRLEGEYSRRKEAAGASDIDSKPVPAIELPDPAVAPANPPANVETRPLPAAADQVRDKSVTPQMSPNQEVQPQSAPLPRKPRVFSEILPKALREGEPTESETYRPMSPAPTANPLATEPRGAEPIQPGMPLVEPLPASPVSPQPARGCVIQEPIGGQPMASPAVSTTQWTPWWQADVQTGCHLDDPQKVAVDLDQLITIALQHSPLLEVVRLDEVLPRHGGYPVSQLTLRYSRPRLPGCDPTLSSELVFVARHRTSASPSDTCAETADFLLQIADAYWNVYRLRALVAIAQRHHDAALALYEQSTRQYASESDRQRFVTVEATIRQRRADANAMRIELKQAQNELAFLVSVPGWQKDIELMPQDVPCQCELSRSEATELELALAERAEVKAAIARLGSVGRQSIAVDARASQELEVVMDLVRLDVKDAMLKLRGNFAQMRLEAETAEKVMEELAVLRANGAETHNIAAMLEAQERLRTAESNYVTALARYNVAILQLRRADGQLFVETPL